MANLEKVINLSDICLLYEEYNKEPEKVKPRLTVIQNKIKAMSYLPVIYKRIISLKVLTQIEDNKDSLELMLQQKAYEIIFGLIDGYSNIKVDMTLSTDILYRVVDILNELEIIDIIKNACERDYNELCNIIEGSIKWEQFLDISDDFSKITPEGIDSLIASIKELENSMDSDTIKNLISITAENDALADIIRQNVAKKIIEAKDLKEEQ